MLYDKTINVLSKIYNSIIKSKVKPSEELENACEYLALQKKSAEKVVKSTIIVSFFAFIISLIFLYILWIKAELSLISTALALAVPVIINHLYSNYYKNKYYAMRVKDMGYLPDFFSILITDLKIKPNLENALFNVSTFDYGKATKGVKKLVKDLEFGKEWDVKKRFINIMKSFNNSSVNRATSALISSLSVRSINKRNNLLNHSLKYLLKGMVSEAENFSKKVYLPILLLFGFGTILPLVVISVIPVLSVLKGTVIDLNSLILFFTASLIIIKFVIDELKKRSPSRFSQVIVKKSLRGINVFLLFVLFIGISSPAIVYLFSNIFPYNIEILEGYHTLFAYIGLTICVSAYFYSKSHKLLKEKKRVELLERELIDAFYHLSSRINEGHSVESSMKYVSDILNDGEAKNFLKKSYHKIKNIGLSIEQVFETAHIIGNIYSQRIKGLVNLFVKSVKKHSRTAGENMIELCNYYTSIYEGEDEMVNSMSKNIDMIKLTSLFFTPIVCSLVINMQRLIENTLTSSNDIIFSFGTSSLSVESVQLVVSIYVFFLSIMLSYLYSFLETNNEQISTYYNAFKTIAVSGVVFTVTLIMSRILLF